MTNMASIPFFRRSKTPTVIISLFYHKSGVEQVYDFVILVCFFAVFVCFIKINEKKKILCYV